MTYLIVEIIVFLALAFLLGLLTGGLLWRRTAAPADCSDLERKLADSQSQVRNLQRRVDTLTSERTHHSPVPDRPAGGSSEDTRREEEELEEGEPEPDEPDEAHTASISAASEQAEPVASAGGPTAAAFLDDLAEVEEAPPAPPPAVLPLAPEPEPAPAPTPDDDAPTTYDDLQRISGIGPVIERQLAELGVTTYRQIARFTGDDIERVGRHLDVFPDRVRREKWVEQAADLHRETYGTRP